MHKRKKRTGRRKLTQKQDPAVFQYYLHDLGYLLLENAREAKKEKDAAADKEDRDYNSGRLMAYHAVISLMQNQARAFGLPLRSVGAAGIDPDNELV